MIRYFKLSATLKNSKEFDVVYKNGKSYANKYLIMYIVKNDLQINRIGISVSKKVGNSVVRHRVTRLIRESYRTNETMFVNGLDIVILARAGAREKNYSDIVSACMHLGRLHKILVETSIL